MARQTLLRLADSAAEPFICRRCWSRINNSATKRSPRRWSSTTTQASAPRPGVLSLLEERGYVKEIAGDRNRLARILDTRQVGVYSGIDPTASSLHLGHLLPLMVLIWLFHHGHSVVSLIGGATAKVGDPSGRLTSRMSMSESTQVDNVRAMSAQMGRLWGNAQEVGRKYGLRGGAGEGADKRALLNNAGWLDSLNILDFLKWAGNGARIGTMLGRDTVKNKMEKGDGMSFAEFTYPLLQAWDWWHMYQHYSVQLQIGGSDQYGNIVAGIDTVRFIAQSQTDPPPRYLDTAGKIKEDYQPMGLTVPLLTTASGEKFGKSAGNAIWLDQSLTSSFDLYGFLLRSADADVERYLNLFTLLPRQHIADTMTQHSQDPGKRLAQHLLAAEVVELAHGSEVAAKTKHEHQQLRAPSLEFLVRQHRSSDGAEASPNSTEETPQQGSIQLPASDVLGQPFAHILVQASLARTKSEARRTIQAGGMYVAKRAQNAREEGDGRLDFVPLKSDKAEASAEFIMDGLLVLRVGKWKVTVIEVVNGGVASLTA
ncbi:hypothetical protein K431DRAFT_263832 [Polychaeton citri CBS 116435]|uniref:Tyrosine--tRNA ligase n=1 Tax=Polychaeton citri CBS 116435 TaxID=1314669 RepID=A0A9P4QB57_9PEZI|nr:hypothetical protein K431DRAFT_263832 [Polychaeton citri CBS 116435]